MTASPASGERSALRGYRWQYDHIAALVYDALLENDFLSMRLTDPQAGKVDDLVLVRRGGADGHQFKSSEFDGFLTLGQVLVDQQTRSGKAAPSLVRALADGWTLLRQQHGMPVRVHLVAQLFASSHDHLGGPEGTHRPLPDHFQAFVAQVLEPLRLGSLSVAEVPTGWMPALARVQAATGLAAEPFAAFVKAFHLDLGARDALPAPLSTRRADIIALSNELYRTVSNASAVVDLNRQQVLDLMGWTERPRLRSGHDFPVDLDTYAPLEAALADLDGKLTSRTRGYVAIIGPPGAGKSTLLSQALTACPDRVVRYYAYVPGSAPARTRMTAQGFLHDVVLMLGRAGLGTAERHMASPDRDQLRGELHEQLDGAARDFAETGRRTILVVDGLDHVERDYPGNDGLLVELPTPSELPEGVLVIAGSRTLTPLSPQARQEIEERGTAISLEHHRLSPAAVLDICRRIPATASLGPELHRRIAQLSGGHPLAFSYLLNRLRDRSESDDPQTVLDNAPAYAGDIAAEYRVVWDLVKPNAEAVEILAVCARLRVGFTTEWLETWGPSAAVTIFRDDLRYLFRRHHDGWHFFHDSFRQFATDRTALDDDGRFDAALDAREHARVADLCRLSKDRRLAAEELYHRHRAGQQDAVLALGQQSLFRQQACNLRSLEAIRTDVGLVLLTYADRGDVSGLLAMLLATIELGDRTAVLESIDLPGALYDAGLIDEAIDACGGDTGRHVPLAHAYRLAERLGRAGRPEGRHLFDLVEHDRFDDPERSRVSGEEDQAAQAWGAGAPLFRPISTILSATRTLMTPAAGHDHRDRFDQGRRRQRRTTIIQALIETLADQGRTDDLLVVDEALADSVLEVHAPASQEVAQLASTEDVELDPEDLEGEIATLVALRVRLRQALLTRASSSDAAQRHVDAILALVKGVPLFYATALDVAELAARYGEDDAAARLLQGSPYANMLTVNGLSHQGESDAVDLHFRYWRLLYVLAHRAADGPGAATVPESVAPDAATPAGNSVTAGAPVHADTDAIELAGRLDAAVRTLARLDADALTETTSTPAEVWTKLLVLLEVFRTPTRPHSSASFGGIARQKTPLMNLIVAVAVRYGAGLPEKLAGVLAHRFTSQPDHWPLPLRLKLATRLLEAGVTVNWYPDLLVAEERAAEEVDVISRLEDLTGLIRRYADHGEFGQAVRLARALVPMSFGVGYRKDYQFTAWVDWLGRALREAGGTPMVAEAVWLARVLVAADPMTEGAPGSAAADLPAAVASASPIGAVRLFEYLVRQGTVRHMDCLAGLVGALVSEQDASSVELAADLTAEVLAPTSDQFYPQLARQVAAAARDVLGTRGGNALAASLADRTDRYALPTARTGWRKSLDLPGSSDAIAEPGGNSSSDDYGALLLDDGRRIARADVPALAPEVRAVLALRHAEATGSTFRWSKLIEPLTLSPQELTALADAFQDGSHDGAEVLAALADRARRSANLTEAGRLADLALLHAPQNSWSSNYRGTRRRAHATAIAAGGPQRRRAGCQDLANQVLATNWFASSLTAELAEVVDALDPASTAALTWPAVRQHLDGIAETLALPPDDVMDNLACRWWVGSPHPDQRAAAPKDTAAAALAEIAVGHLAHPTWVVHEGATRVVVRALKAGNVEVAEALARFAQPNAADDLLEAAGRCLAAARLSPGYTTPHCLTPLEQALAGHRSQVLRDLAPDSGSPGYRTLSPLYHLLLPPAPDEPLIGRQRRFLAPHEDQYQILADGLGLDLEAVYAVADMYAARLLNALPNPDEVRGALRSSSVQHAYPSGVVLASRGAFGRVLADLTDAGLLEAVPAHVARQLRTVDLDLLDAPLQPRPSVLPPAPLAGHDQTVLTWLAGVDDRLQEYATHAKKNRAWLLGATSRVTVLNWDHLEEEFRCGALLDAPSRTGREPLFTPTRALRLSDLTNTTAAATDVSSEDPLVQSNNGWAFHQLAANWLAFRPDVAVTLGWTPDLRTPGRWFTTGGEKAVETVSWIDGWWGRSGPAFDDTDGDGWAVIASDAGLADLTAQLGPITRVFRLSRWGRHDGEESEHVQASNWDTPTTGG